MSSVLKGEKNDSSKLLSFGCIILEKDCLTPQVLRYSENLALLYVGPLSEWRIKSFGLFLFINASLNVGTKSSKSLHVDILYDIINLENKSSITHM